METVTVSTKFQVVIPKRSREELDIQPGQKLVVIERGNALELVKIGPLEKAQGFIKGSKISWRDVRDHRERFG